MAFTTIDEWFSGLRQGKFRFFSRGKQAEERAKKAEKIVQVRETVSAALATFREQGRCAFGFHFYLVRAIGS